MRGEGRTLRFETEHHDVRLFWPAEPDTEFIAVLPTLYSIAVASKSRPEILRILSELIATAQERFGAIAISSRDLNSGCWGFMDSHPGMTGSAGMPWHNPHSSMAFLHCVNWNVGIQPESGTWKGTVTTGIKSIRWEILWTGLS